jgi:hypothetical protein
VELEDELNELDSLYCQSKEVLKDKDRTHNGSFRLDRETKRTVVLKKLVDAVSQYSKLTEW